ncbi:MAG: helix-turn-helix transcriptional regulator [Bdellovibrionales bacterium]|jgi:DNA-binding XRE family transcriptional regulator
MITGRQIRAARALLDISQDELAEATGLTPQAIRKIENGDVQPREGTIADITRAFNEHRLEFTDNQGVRFIPEDVEVLSGDSGFLRFTDLIYTHLQMKGGTIRQLGIEESYFEKCNTNIAEAHRKRMAPLVHSRKDIFVRAILNYGDTQFISTDYAEYRWHPTNAPKPIPYYIFGDSVCIFALEAQPSPKIICISSPIIAAAYTTQFDQVWDMSSIPRKENK